MSEKAVQLKEEGNRHFQQQDYVGAEGLYSKAIIADAKNPALYTNRAMARLKLGLWDSVISDCKACLELSPDNMKAFYYLSQAELALKDFDTAVSDAMQAHELCVQIGDKSLAAITAQVLRCKKERWEDKEKRRVREGARLEEELVSLLERSRAEAINGVENPSDQDQINTEWAAKVQQLHDTFEGARSASERRRNIPDWVIDDITFGIMVDPVVTKTGKSYERASIMEHLRRSSTDPLTRQPLTPADLTPNLDLKQACEQFLEENGWAVDW